MEYLIVKVLGFDLSVPTPFALITAMCTMNNVPEKPKFLAMVKVPSLIQYESSKWVCSFSIFASFPCLKVKRTSASCLVNCLPVQLPLPTTL